MLLMLWPRGVCARFGRRSYAGRGSGIEGMGTAAAAGPHGLRLFHLSEHLSAMRRLTLSLGASSQRGAPTRATALYAPFARKATAAPHRAEQPAWELQLDEPQIARAAHGILAPAHAELGEDPPRVALDGVQRHVQRVADLALAELGGEQAKYGEL